MKFLFLILSVLCFLPGCSQNVQNSYDYDCASSLSKDEIKKFQYNTFEDYTDEDLDLLAEITSYITDANPEKDSYECFFNKRANDLLVLDVYGLESEESINKTMCGLSKNKKLPLPKNIIILFHKYIDGFKDGGIIAGLRMK